MADSPEAVHWYTVAEACAYLRVSKTTLYDYMNSGRLKFYNLAGTRTRRFRQSDLDALLELGSPAEVTEGSDDDL